jgi:hypothetical protein
MMLPSVLLSVLFLCVLACWCAGESAPDMPPNSPETRENPAIWAELRQLVLGFPKRRGGDSNPRYRLRGTTVFEGSALGPVAGI